MKRTILFMIIVAVLALSGCQTVPAESPDETAIPVVKRTESNVILAEARVEAVEQRSLAFEIGGTVIELRVDEGDTVEAGQVLARLSNVDAALAVKQADAALQQAEAQLALTKAGPSKADLAVLEAQLRATQSVITQTTAQRDQLYAGGTEAQLAAAEAQLAAAKSDQLQARMFHDETMKCYDIPNSDNKSCPLLGDTEEKARFALAAADQAVLAAEAQLEAIQSDARAQARIANAGIGASEAQVAVVQAQLAQAQAGASAEAIAVAEAAVMQAQVGLETAQAALDKHVLIAPFDGTVTLLMIDEGSAVAYGQPVLNLTMAGLQVRTVDLDELNIVNIAVGMDAEVVADALPDVVMRGTVSEISPEAMNNQGDVVYPVVVILDEAHSLLRLGMTVEVRFQLEP